MKYVVIMLNYNSYDDACLAIQSVLCCATESYKILVVDNKSDDTDKLLNLRSDLVDVLTLEENLGYAKGNNEGAKYAIRKWNPQYLVFMNPDVVIKQKATIESVIRESELYGAIGGQPLVNTYGNNWPPDKQVNIRRVRNYTDILVSSSVVLKKIFVKKFGRTIYRELMPYNSSIKYEVPSGAFFVIKAIAFEKVGFFDGRTFLYNEEEILGYKIKENNDFFVLNCKCVVNHIQGKSTGAHGGIVNKFALNCELDSLSIYMKEYLKCNDIQIGIAKTIIRINPILEILEGKLKLFIKYIIKRGNR